MSNAKDQLATQSFRDHEEQQARMIDRLKVADRIPEAATKIANDAVVE